MHEQSLATDLSLTPFGHVAVNVTGATARLFLFALAPWSLKRKSPAAAVEEARTHPTKQHWNAQASKTSLVRMDQAWSAHMPRDGRGKNPSSKFIRESARKIMLTSKTQS